ncbi:hypothetical protein STSP2_03400 [Anaerohalosphaera lusitana]|uniref:Uncharacterized protein n=1 Tax=Anaerohalosphaera lusitana TaxID=1936003 RepID=A0A1U9NQV0_9BACT|nr:hypothetical protein [Anaerohalosphaera lusitana]AQT70195.1 hypothetical protein STSP2_03400 [Anaerohalosphaera lusitana]
MSKQSALEVVFNMVNGRQLRFRAHSEEDARNVIQSINPQKFFSERKEVSLFGNASQSSILLDAVAFMVFETPIKLDWPYPIHFSSAKILNRNLFIKAATDELPRVRQILDSNQAGKPIPLFLELVIEGGRHWFLRAESETLMPAERMQIPKTLRDITGFHATGPGGGGVLFNMNRVVSWTLHPPLTDPNSKAWRMAPIRENP